MQQIGGSKLRSAALLRLFLQSIAGLEADWDNAGADGIEGTEDDEHCD